MKVIFLQDVPNVAKAGETKDVANGYGRNFLIPRKLALLANSPTIDLIETQHKIVTRQQQEIEAGIAEIASQLDRREIFLKAKVGTGKRLYGSITNADIATELENTTGLVIDKKKIEMDKPFNQLGSYDVSIRLAKDVVPKVKVTVTEEEKEID